MKGDRFFTEVFFAFLIGLFFIYLFAAEGYCLAAWEGSGLEARYKHGCQVKVRGQWYPDETIKVIP